MSFLTTTTGAGGFQPDAYAELVVRPVQRDSVAFRTLQLIQNNATETHIPVVKTDPAAGWFAEAAALTPADGTVDTVTVTPKKVAGYSLVSNEMVNGSDPQSLEIIGGGLARDIVAKIDSAFFANTTVNGPSGLLSATGYQTVDTGAAFANLDAFAEAISKCEEKGGTVGFFVTTPATALALSKLKVDSTSNEHLLGGTATDALDRRILGVPLLVSPHVGAGDTWAIPTSGNYVVQSGTAELETDTSVAFDSYQTAVRAVMRVAFGFADPEKIIRMYDAV